MEELIISSSRRMGPNRREFRLNAGVTGLESQAKIGVDIAALKGRSNDEPAGSTGSGSRGRRARQNMVQVFVKLAATEASVIDSRLAAIFSCVRE